MPHFWIPRSGFIRRLAFVALATFMMLSAVVVIPGAAESAHAEDVVTAATGPSITVEKSTNGEDADNAPGPVIPTPDDVVWTYLVTNDGGEPLSGVTITDANNDDQPIVCTGQENGSITLEPGASIECTSTSVSWYAEGHRRHRNEATVTGFAAISQVTVSDSDASHYTPMVSCPLQPAPDRTIVDFHQGSASRGFLLERGDSIGPIAADIPAGTYRIQWASYDAHTHKPGQTQPYEQWYIETGDGTSGTTSDIPDDVDYLTGTLAAPLVVNSAQTEIRVVHGAPVAGINSVYAVCVAFDPIPPSIDVTKTVDKPVIEIADTVQFTITVENTGPVTLTELELEDVLTYGSDSSDRLAQCEQAPVTTLAPGESTQVTCTEDLSYTEHGDEVLNTVTATAVPTTGGTVSDTDTATVTIVSPAGQIAISKLVWNELGSPPAWVDNGFLPQNQTVARWQITVTNPGTVDVSGLALTDEHAPGCETDFAEAIAAKGWGSPADLTIPAGMSVAFECESAETPGAPGTNTAAVQGVDPAGRIVGPVDDSASFGRAAASGRIGDTVWADDNANGKQDDGEKGIANAVVRLTLPDGSTTQTTTNANGLYLFSALPAGTYKAELVLSSIPKPSEGDLKLTTAGSFTVNLEDGGSYLDADFGVATTLPNTGASTDQIGVVALSLLLSGTALLTVTRRRTGEDGAEPSL